MKLSHILNRPEQEMLTPKSNSPGVELAGQKFDSLLMARILKPQRFETEDQPLIDSDAIRHTQDMRANYLADEMSKSNHLSISTNLAHMLNRK